MNSRLSTQPGRTGFLACNLAMIWCVLAAAQPSSDLVKKGDAEDRKLRPEEALKYYLPAEKATPDDPALLVRIAKQYSFLMTDAGTKEEKLRLGNIALGYAKRAVTLAPNNADTQVALAFGYGKMMPLQPAREKVENSRVVKEAADKAISIDPRNDYAWHLLGRWHQVLADLNPVTKTLAQVIYGKLPAASNEDALHCFEKAIALNSGRLIHHIELGRTYAQMGRATEARKHIEKGLSMPELEKDDADAKRRGRESLAKLK